MNLTLAQRTEALSLARQDDWYDGWGTLMQHRFGIAEALYHAGDSLPAEWQFRHGAASGCLADWPDSEYRWMLSETGQVSADQLRYAGNVLDRLARLYVRAGKDY